MSTRSNPVMRVNVEGRRPSEHKFKWRELTKPPSKDCFVRKVPIINSIANYKLKEYLVGDLVAGLTVGVMLVPQGMAYAMLATLSPEYGLYSAVVPIIVYAIFGTSRQLAVGPVAIVSLLVAEALEAEQIHSPEKRAQVAHILAFFVGIINIVLGIFRAGILSSFLSHSVLLGFTGGAAIVIGLSQLKHLLGFNIESSQSPFMTIVYALRDIKKTNVTSLVMGLVAIVLMLLLRYMKRRWGRTIDWHPTMNRSKRSVKVENFFRNVIFFAASFSALEIVIIGTIVSRFLIVEKGLEMKIVGDVPAGFPAPSAPDFELLQEVSFGRLFVSALIMSLLGFMESYAVADRFARSKGYSVDANQELTALGAANLFGSFFNAYPIAGGFGRSAVNEASGAVTVIASVISSLVLLFVISFLTSSFYYMPRSILAAIVLVAVSSLLDYEAMALTWKINRSDFGVIMFTFFATIFLGTEIGLACGVVSSIMILLHKVAFPHMAVLGKVISEQDEEMLFRNVDRFPDATLDQGILIFRIDSSINFASKDAVLKRLYREIKKVDFTPPSEDPDREYAPAVILSCEGVNSIDVAGLEALVELRHFLAAKGISLVAASVKGPVRDAIEKQNVHLRDEKKSLLLPWSHTHFKESNVTFPTSFMVSTIEAAYECLKGGSCNQPSSSDTSETEENSLLSQV